jgi:hypothetical protein
VNDGEVLANKVLQLFFSPILKSRLDIGPEGVEGDDAR